MVPLVGLHPMSKKFESLDQVRTHMNFRNGEKTTLGLADFIDACQLLLPELHEAYISVSDQGPGGHL